MLSNVQHNLQLDEKSFVIMRTRRKYCKITLKLKKITLSEFGSGNCDHENPYRNQPVVLKYHTGSRLGHVQLHLFFFIQWIHSYVQYIIHS